MLRTERTLTQPPGHEPWGIILAGGEGIRLRPLTRAITGDERPKQFCPILNRETLLEWTRRRVALVVPRERTLLVITRAHERFYAPLLAGVPSSCMVVQPENRGTAPAILYALLRLAEIRPLDAVAVFPSDHFVSDDARFMVHVHAALEAVRTRPELMILLGIMPESPEIEYGWIEPGDPLLKRHERVFHRVRRFWEKPSLPVAEMLMARRCLWNSFVMVARLPALLALVRSATPELYSAFVGVRPRVATPNERDAVRELYSRLPSTSFSREVLATRSGNFAVLPVSGVVWSDWGQPDRVMATLARMQIHPEWAEVALPMPA